MDVYAYIDNLIDYAYGKLELDPHDEYWVRNSLLAILDGCDVSDLSSQKRDEVYGAIMLPPSAVNAEFGRLMKKDGKAATDWLYRYCVDGDYVKRAVLDRNPRFELGGLVITINKAKPEYVDPKKAASGNSISDGYGKCSICRENEGYGGRSKRTLRTVDLTLGGEKWFWQYSPYGYFNEHGIAVNCTHTPMHVDRAAFARLMDFVDMFPHYFIGCNAALPRIGGSVLAHDHYQGGGEILPMHKAKAAFSLRHPDYSDAAVEVLDWNGTVVRVISRNRQTVTALCDLIRVAWVNYNNAALGIVSEDGGGVHNAVSPTVIKTERGYEMNLILRSNLTSAALPDGVFNTRAEYRVIKKESVGLIEAQGLFILPGRLDDELKEIEMFIEGGKPLPDGMRAFCVVYDRAKNLYEQDKAAGAANAVRLRLAEICADILTDTAVFKDKAQTVEFLRGAGIV